MKEAYSQAPQECLTGNGKENILFPQPGFLMGAQGRFGEERGSQLIKEYLSVLFALSSVKDHQLKLTRNSVVGVKANNGFAEHKVFEPKEDLIREWDTVELNMPRYASEAIFSRDLFVNLGEYVFVDPVAMEVEQSDTIIQSPLGEGGKVLHSGKSILLTEDLWHDHRLKPQFKMLRDSGYTFGALPFVKSKDNERGKDFLVETHIDGHVNIITGEDDKKYILYASSYAAQTRKARTSIKQACEYVDAEPVEIHDENLPHLALNFIQAGNGTVVATSGADELTNVLTELVGEKKVITTSVPVELLPRYFRGGIRCMTNFCSDSLLSQIRKPSPLHVNQLLIK